MKIQFLLSGGPDGWHAACGAALLTALFAVVPFRAFADQPAATHADGLHQGGLPARDAGSSARPGGRHRGDPEDPGGAAQCTPGVACKHVDEFTPGDPHKRSLIYR